MATREMNELLTQVGPGTRMGSLLRRYWHPITATSELDKDPVHPVRLLGEDLVLFRTERGELGLIGDRCAHRGISMAYGIPQEGGLRCAYHGWLYDTSGTVIDMPFEPACAHFKIPSYRVQEMSGLVFAYLGPDPAPLLPRWDLYARDDLDKEINIIPLPCNWLQCMDNSLDPAHFEHLHAVYGNYVLKKLGRPPAMNPARHLKIDFDVFDYGIYKRRLVEGEREDCDDWTTGHPILFPNILAQGDGARMNFQIRVPVDDQNTLEVRYIGVPRKPGAEPRTEIPVRHLTPFNPDGKIVADQINKQDWLAWIGQGYISDRTTEHLVTSDKGILLYRKVLMENIERVERGEDPMGVIRDPDVNEPFIPIRREQVGYSAFWNLDGQSLRPERAIGR